MKKLVLLFVLSCSGCAATSPTAELNWRKADVEGTLTSIPYTIDLNNPEIQLHLFEHNGTRVSGGHTVQIQPNEIEYRLKYVF